MHLNLIRNLTHTVVAVAAGVFGSPLLAQDDRCGTHSVDNLFQEILGNHTVLLTDGVVMGRAIPDKTDEVSLLRVNDDLGLIMGGDAMPRMEFDLDRVAAEDVLDFGGAGFQINLNDYGTVTGCADVSNFPQYFGTGYWLSADGVRTPATLRLFLWLGNEGNDGVDQSIEGSNPTLNAIGVLRSGILNGKIVFS